MRKKTIRQSVVISAMTAEEFEYVFNDRLKELAGKTIVDMKEKNTTRQGMCSCVNNVLTLNCRKTRGSNTCRASMTSTGTQDWTANVVKCSIRN